ncbi:RteC domain-containing protein [Mucilaginibacter polytrichastri]|uniref:Uncharacterized protein n=1 Tax=Mucilaginibacter polytrichastri TaxID=1302689 RepID=A0A1Q6A408_9SPHI|nr:RteC domain-containing protein [Mucilaginibacter polytrichastri]OKS88733.1 hypothetical protein RG47T_4211 [Mucilaginibacter polytrichastri]SFT04991.1 RteC protein [Mucilaginibacter polytrichastri]
MTNELIQLFDLWENVKYSSEQIMEKSNYIEAWDQLCWRIQFELNFEKDNKASILNAVVVLSDRIYERYKRNRRQTFLRVLLDKLSALLADHVRPEKYRRTVLKIALIESAGAVALELDKLEVASELSSRLKSALKDISGNFGPSLISMKYLDSLANWLRSHTPKTTEDLVDHLIATDFNHPAFLDYLFNMYELQNIEAMEDGHLHPLKKRLKAKQLRLEIIILRPVEPLIKGSESVASKLQALLTTEIRWIDAQLNHLRCLNLKQLKLSEQQVSNGSKPVLNKRLTKWPSEKSDLVELAYGLYVYMRSRGSLITIAALVKWFEDAFGVDLARYSHRFAEIKMRKSTRPSKFLDAMVNEFLVYVEEGNAFEPPINLKK